MSADEHPKSEKGTDLEPTDDHDLRHETITAQALQQLVFAPLDFIVEGLIPAGLTIVAGLPKVGKSWLSLDIAASVALGTQCLGDRRCPAGDVLYLALEDNFRRLQNRLEAMLGPEVVWPQNLQFRTNWPRSDEGGLDRLSAWLEAATAPRCVIIDIFERFRQGAKSKGSAYQQNYHDLGPPKELATKHRVAIIIVHHLRKSIASRESIEQVSGSIGLTGAADTILMLGSRRTGIDKQLQVIGRDIESVEFRAVFHAETTRWQLFDIAVETSLTPERARTLALLKERGAMSPTEIAEALQEAIGTIRTRLSRMVQGGQLRQIGPASYCIPEHGPKPDSPDGVAPATAVTDVTGVTAVTPLPSPNTIDAAMKGTRRSRSNSRRKLVVIPPHPTASDEVLLFSLAGRKKT